MIRRNGTYLLTLAVLAGCSSVADRRQADSGFDYLDTPPATALKAPAGLSTPEQSREYRVPEVQGEHPVGPAVDIRAPQLILPVVANSRVEEGAALAVTLDAQTGQADVVSDIRSSLDAWLAARAIPVTQASETELVTDWFVPAEGESLLALSDDVDARRKFRINIHPEGHRRTATLSVEHLGSESLEEGIDAGSGERIAAALINDWLIYYGNNQALQNQQLALQKFQPIASRLGLDANGVPSFLLEADFERSWSRIPLVLEHMGFEVKDFDKSLGTLFVEYTGATKGSFWDSLFGSGGDLELSLDDDDYQVQLGEMGELTSVSFVDDDGKPVKADVYSEMSNAFTSLMRDGDLKEPK
ncbi:outer membrane protein assembly factor BamC [Gallaecimonas sp. GXIMD4217]|uniref:outer membrane protein assembly factor BamC n=1 Tax=Gallaecimonas sp. GXIMD4217 TaxID=3131927 RepID=UPI00311AEC44